MSSHRLLSSVASLPARVWFTTQQPRLPRARATSVCLATPQRSRRRSHSLQAGVVNETEKEYIVEDIGRQGRAADSSHPGLESTEQEQEEQEKQAAAAEPHELGTGAPHLSLSDSQVLDLDGTPTQGPAFTFSLNVLWMENVLGVAIDQVAGAVRGPLTPYFFWPQEDAWEGMKKTLAKDNSWISQEHMVALLNGFTELINYWESQGSNLEEAQRKFPTFKFHG